MVRSRDTRSRRPDADLARRGGSGKLVKRFQVKGFASGYQAGLEAIFALIVAAGLGGWVDSRYETAPAFLLVGMAVGFGSCVLRLLRYQRRQQEAREASGDDAAD
jgi:F0F1-type ATP synthase assembly protein I